MSAAADEPGRRAVVSSLSAEERETTITSTDADAEIRIWTAQPRFLGRLRRHPAFTEVKSGVYGSTEWAEFTIPAARWNPATGAKRTGRILTEEQRDRARATLARNRSASLLNDHADQNGAPTVGNRTDPSPEGAPASDQDHEPEEFRP